MDSGIYAFIDEISRKLLDELQKDAKGNRSYPT